MSANKNSTAAAWADPDDAPDLSSLGVGREAGRPRSSWRAAQRSVKCRRRSVSTPRSRSVPRNRRGLGTIRLNAALGDWLEIWTVRLARQIDAETRRCPARYARYGRACLKRFANPQQSRYSLIRNDPGRGEANHALGDRSAAGRGPALRVAAGWDTATRSRSSTPISPPPRSRCPRSPGKPLLMAGVSAARAVEAVLSVMPLDTFVPDPAEPHASRGRPARRAAGAARGAAGARQSGQTSTSPLVGIERFEFYERAKRAFVILIARRAPLLRLLHLQEGRRPAGVTPSPACAACWGRWAGGRMGCGPPQWRRTACTAVKATCRAIPAFHTPSGPIARRKTGVYRRPMGHLPLAKLPAAGKRLR